MKTNVYEEENDERPFKD